MDKKYVEKEPLWCFEIFQLFGWFILNKLATALQKKLGVLEKWPGPD